MEPALRYQEARKVTLIGALINSLLALIKIAGGVAGHSSALLADGIHAFSDLLTDILVIFATRFGSRHADDDHPYGHGRIETAATAGLALLLLGVGIAIFYDGIDRLLFNQFLPKPRLYVFLIAFLSIGANEVLFHYTLRISALLKSNLLQANAWHHRSDAAASLVVLMGIAGAWFGYPYLDTVAAIIVGLLIVKMGLSLIWSSLRELVDTGLDADNVAKIESIILAVPGVIALHQLRTRSMGHEIFVDAHILVASDLTVSEGHYIAQAVHTSLMEKMTAIADVTVHVDSEDDEYNKIQQHLPCREEIIPLLKQRWQGLPGALDIQIIRLHYLNNKIVIEIIMPLAIVEKFSAAEALLKQYLTAINDLEFIKDCQILFAINHS